MASVIIKEQDYTKSETYNPTDTVVYIPGLSTNLSSPTGPVLYEDVETFVSQIGATPQILEDENNTTEQEVFDKSYIMAKQLLSVGMKVLYEVAKDGTTQITTEEEMVRWLGDTANWEKLYDRSLYNIRFITSGGYSAIRNVISTAEPIATNMINCAYYNAGGSGDSPTGRGDCVALIDHPLNATINNIKDVFGAGGVATTLQAASSFGAAFTPWCKFNITVDLGVNTYESEVNPNSWSLPGSFAYLLAYKQMLGQNPTWYATAGLNRGAIPLLEKPLLTIGDLAARDLQARDPGAVAVNPIINVPGYGYRIWGNRTLLQNGADGLKATSFLNIRNLCSDIKKTSYQACKFVTFEQNTDVMWANLKSHITPLLDKMASGEGIRGYKVTRVPTKEKAKVIGKIKIVPIEAVEDFELTIQLVDSLETETEA